MGLCNGAGESIIYSGVTLSTLGFGLLIATALVFKSWMNHAVNRVWLYMCFTKLMFVFAVTFYTLIYCKHVTVCWMESELGYAIFWGVSDYFMLATSGWMATGAWVAYNQLVNIIAICNSRHMLLVSILPVLAPIPVVVARSLLWKPVRPADFVSMLPIMYQVVLLLNFLFSLGLYTKVLYSVVLSASDSGRRQDLLGTTVLAIVFLLTSGIQYVIVIVTSKHYDRKSDPHFVLYSIVLWLVMNSVFLYSILFVVGIKQTRKLWVGLLANKSKKVPV